jgi:excisionase family DNA binding protein
MEERFSMGKAAEQLGVSKNTLYLWEKAGKIALVKRTARNNYRFYTREDIEKIRAWMDQVKVGGE